MLWLRDVGVSQNTRGVRKFGGFAFTSLALPVAANTVFLFCTTCRRRRPAVPRWRWRRRQQSPKRFRTWWVLASCSSSLIVKAENILEITALSLDASASAGKAIRKQPLTSPSAAVFLNQRDLPLRGKNIQPSNLFLSDWRQNVAFENQGSAR